MGGPVEGGPLPSQQATRLASTKRANGDESAVTPGTMIGRYIVLGRLGAGGMGVVYLAYDPELNRRVALKLIRAPSSADDKRGESAAEELRARLLREAQALAQLSHPNVVTVYDVGTVDDAVFIAMAYLEGQNWSKWAKGHPRSWREVLPFALAAGRGLAAAHAAGLVHRDFKPSNVIIDASGRAYVLDFGLAHGKREGGSRTRYNTDDADTLPAGSRDGGAVSSTLEDTVVVTSRAASGSHHSTLREPLTEIGAIVGTPAYMAPEQYMGQTDHRTDQFSFCVTLFEILYGQRPFSGRDRNMRLAAIYSGPRFDIQGPRIPRWLRLVLARGLQADPELRYPSLDDLLDDLGRDPWVVRRRWIAATTAILTVTVASVGYHQLSTAPLRHCIDSADAIHDEWTENRRTRIAGAFAKVSDPSAPRAFTTASEFLDAYANQWRESYTRACVASHEEASQSGRLLDLRVNCLTRRLDSFSSTLAVFENPDETTVRTAIDAVHQLPAIDDCDDAEALLADVPPPEDPAVRRQVEKLRRELTSLQALQFTGRLAQVPAEIEAVLARVESIDYLPLHAEARQLLIHTLIRLGRNTEADAHIEQAVFQAERSGALALAASLETAAGWTRGYIARDFDVAEQHLRHAEALLDAAGNPPTEQSFLHHIRGVLLGAEGHKKKSAAEIRKSLEIRRRHFHSDDPRITMSLNNLATSVGNPTPAATEEALTLLREVADRHRKLWHGANPDLALTMTNIGGTLLSGGRYRDAIPELEAAVTMWGDLGQVDDPLAVAARNLLARAHLMLGRPTKAGTVLQASIDKPEMMTGCPPGPQVADRAELIARIYIELGRNDDAAVVLDSAVDACAAAFGDDHDDLAPLRLVRAAVALLHNDLDRADQELSSVLKNAPSPTGAETESHFEARLVLGQLQLRRGETERAIEQLETTLSDGIQSSGEKHPELSEVRRWLGRAYAAAGRHDAAGAMYEIALTSLEAAIGSTNPGLIEVLLDSADLAVQQKNVKAARSLVRRARECWVSGETNPILRARIATIAADLARTFP